MQAAWLDAINVSQFLAVVIQYFGLWPDSSNTEGIPINISYTLFRAN